MRIASMFGLAVALAVAASPATASTVSINFNEAALDTTGTTGIGNFYQAADGVKFGAHAYAVPDPNNPGNVMSLQCATNEGCGVGQSIFTTIDLAIGFTSLAFDWVAGNVSAVEFLNGSTSIVVDPISAGGISAGHATFSNFGTATEAKITGGNLQLTLDNLVFVLAAPGGGGGTAPEPGTLALAGLALTTFWALRRRHQL